MYVDSIVRGYKLFEVPPDFSLRKELEEKTIEELTKILKSYKVLHNVTDIDTRKRVIRAIEIEKYYSEDQKIATSFPSIRSLVIGIMFDRETRRRRISERLKDRLERGMLDEVKQLMDNGIDSETMIYYGLEYKYLTLYLTGRMTYDEMFKSLEVAIHQFGKRQMTWFRGMERRGIQIHWIDGTMLKEKNIDKIITLLQE